MFVLLEVKNATAFHLVPADDQPDATVRLVGTGDTLAALINAVEDDVVKGVESRREHALAALPANSELHFERLDGSTFPVVVRPDLVVPAAALDGEGDEDAVDEPTDLWDRG